uniref:CSON008947 protein n=1 Tax=Culicoides sonorensis TaxID=179676 RepID=A0A336M3A9_CULSO
MMKHIITINITKSQSSELNSTVDSSMEGDDHVEEIQVGVQPPTVDRGKFSFVEKIDLSQAYNQLSHFDNIDSENQSPNIGLVAKPSKEKGAKRIATNQDLEEPAAQAKGRGRKKQKSPEKQQTDFEPVLVKNPKQSRKAYARPKPMVNVPSFDYVDESSSPIIRAIIRNKNGMQEAKPYTKPLGKAKVVPKKASAKMDSASNDQEARALRIRAINDAATAMPSTSSAPSAAPIKIKIPVQPKSSQHPRLRDMLSVTMKFFKPEEKGVSIKRVIHHLAHEYEYRNEMAIKKAVKRRIASGEYIQTTGVGLNGKFKLPPISKRAKKTDDSVTSQSNAAEPRKQS